jgi:hypothetical protein
MTLVQTRQCLHLNIVKCKSLQFLPSSCPELCLSVQIVVFGGTETDMATAQTPSSSSSYRINLGAAAPAWETETMPYPRVMGDAVLLPDGTVFVANGGQIGEMLHSLTSSLTHLLPCSFICQAPVCAN